MADQAQVKSVEALESLRAAMVIFQTKARRAVDLALDEVIRTRQWLQVDRRIHWESQIRHWTRVLERAKAELMTVRLSALVDRSFRHEEAVRSAERALHHAQEKSKLVKRWVRDFENAVAPHVHRLESVREHYMHNLPKAIAWLHQAQVTLDAYSESRHATLSGATVQDLPAFANPSGNPEPSGTPDPS